ncbi:MAG: O-antigen ligase family protein [Planctomycetota bacterium]|nr:MAG: O-antigen ligase family protein [Planctomycetota bacterium]
MRARWRAGIQVFSEHPTLVDEFRQNRGAFLASHGWVEGSAAARVFERRMMQPDASAWFAMSNVYASVMVGCAVVFVAGLVAAVRGRLWATGARPDLYRFVGVLAGAVMAVGGIVMAVPAGGSLPKGAVAALVLGLGLFGVAAWRERMPGLVRRGLAGLGSGRLGWWFGPGLIAAALAAVVVRGVVGERVGELSLLFRWFYLQAATGIFAEHPVWGVGPDGFQSAYLLAKNPLSPEEVSSPHSVLFDYVSMLGVFGLAWCGVVVTLAARAGREWALGSGTPDGGEGGPGGSAVGGRGAIGWLGVVIGLSGLVAIWRETLPTAAAVPEAYGLLLLDGVTKLAGFVLVWLGLGAALLTVSRRAPGVMRAGLVAGGLAVLVHAQIELTGTDLSGAGWMFVVLGAGAAGRGLAASDGGGTDTDAGARAGGRWGWLAGSVVAGVLGLLVVAASVPVWGWERGLRGAAARAGTATRLAQRFEARGQGLTDESPELLVAELSAMLGRDVEMSPEGVGRAVEALRMGALEDAAEALEGIAREPATPSRAAVAAAGRVRRAAGPGGGGVRRGRGPAGPAEAVAAMVDLARWGAERWPGDSSAYRRLAGALRQRKRRCRTGAWRGRIRTLRRWNGRRSWTRSARSWARELALRYRESGDVEAASRWAGKALALHELSRLDPLAGLSDREVQMLREVASDP